MAKTSMPEWMKRNIEADNRETERLRRLVLREDAAVNWEAIRGNFFEPIGTRWHPKRGWYSVDDAIWRILYEEGILSPEMNGNYLVMGASVLLNPRLMTPLYFTRESDAHSYVELMYGGAMYDVDVIQCRVVRAIKRRS